MNFNEKLQSLRKSSGITQEGLAEKLGVTRQTISKWECGDSTPDFQNLVKISDIFAVSTDYLLKDKEPEKQTESSAPQVSEIRVVKKGIDKKTLLGACLFCVGALCLITFLILSLAFPCTVMNNYGTFEGFAGFLLFTNTVVPFFAVCVMMLVGFLLLISPLIKDKIKK